MAPEDTFEISDTNGYLVSEAGNAGDSFRSGGSKVMEGAGKAIVNVNDKKNDGLVTGSVALNGTTYTIVMKEFEGIMSLKMVGSPGISISMD